MAARTFALALALVALGLVAFAGCGGEEDVSPTPESVEGTLPEGATGETETGGGGGGAAGDAAAGKEVFASAGCGSCHTFADAGTSGTVGPDLDQSSASPEQVLEQVTNGGGGMPAFSGQLSEQQIADVSAYVVEARGG
jgi:mono/diheme cytochrome c family protein